MNTLPLINWNKLLFVIAKLLYICIKEWNFHVAEFCSVNILFLFKRFLEKVHERVSAFKEFHDDTVNQKFNDPKITVKIDEGEYN